jgi:predicted ATPase
MATLPTGTVTFLFTDIEGSTRLLHQLGAEAYDEALVEHRRLLRDIFSCHGGVEVDTQGDAFFYAFPTAPGALKAAREGQGALASGPIRVRMGLHTGAPHVGKEGYVGQDVHLGARIAASAHGGQVVLSQTTRDCAQVEVLDLGEHRLKDFTEPVWIFQLGEERFPPLKTISNTNLPHPASSFVGREREVGEVASLLREGARLLTLTGPGGSGKTRLSIEAASELVPYFKNGVFWVGLASLRDPTLVVESVAQTLGTKNGLAAHVGERELLLLLDNFEQVVDAAPELSSLVEVCPNLKVLVTSRELLRIRGEVEYRVPPLAEPEAVELFAERAQLDADETVAELCHRLDNLPLAVELAAARTSVLSPAQILERLSRRLDLLKGGRDADPRQQTLRATIEWSYRLLSPEGRTIFRRLSVFAGGCRLEAAEQVAGADLETLQTLVDKSLLRFANERFWMLETIREYALERLDESPDVFDIRRRHAEHYLKLAEASGLSSDVEVPQRFDLVLADQSNLRAALAWLARGEAGLALSLAVSLEMFWVTRNPEEGRRWFDTLLGRPDDVPPALRAHGLRAYGGATIRGGDLERGQELYEQSLAAYRALADDHGAAQLLTRLGEVAVLRGKLGEGRGLLQESLELHAKTGFRKGEAQSSSALARAEKMSGNLERALELARKSAEIFEEGGYPWLLAGGWCDVAEYALDLGDLHEAAVFARKGLALFWQLEDRQAVVFALALLAGVNAARDDAASAGRLWGAITAEAARQPLPPWESEREPYAAQVLAVSGPEFERGCAEGGALSLADAVEQALSDT